MAALRFHLDQHVPNAVAYGLRQFGVDVTTTHEAGLQDADDPDQLAFALRELRVLDADFIERLNRGEPHSGICYAPQDKYQRKVGDLLRAVYLVFVCLSDQDMKGHIEYL
ncbi:MAG: DUF5615 family PIN-like protein [Planctomycetales bacterium]|nr:DUF5615 family PIN-like protein [Planctomycetales bacterium]